MGSEICHISHVYTSGNGWIYTRINNTVHTHNIIANTKN